MSCSTALSWGAALSSRATGASRAGLPVVRHRRLSGALSALSLSVWSGVDFWRIAARRPRSAGGILPAVVPGDASAGGVASPLSGVAARRAGAVWRGGLQRRLARLKSLLGNLGCAIPRCISSTRKCASRAACSLSISAATRISDFQQLQLRGWSGAGGSHLPEGQSLPALYWRASGCAKIGINAFSRLAARCALAGLWFTVSDGSVARKRRIRRRLRKQRAMFSAARG